MIVQSVGLDKVLIKMELKKYVRYQLQELEALIQS